MTENLIHDVKEAWRFVNFISAEFPDIEDSGNDLYKKVDALSKELEAIKRRLSLK